MVLTVLNMSDILLLKVCCWVHDSAFDYLYYLTMARYMVEVQQYETALQNDLLSKIET